MSTEEQDLILRAKDGDRGAFGEIYTRYKKRIYYYLYRLVRSEEVAQELLQETFIHLYTSLETYMPTGKVAALIYTSAHNTATNWQMRQSRGNKIFSRQKSSQDKSETAEPLEYIKDDRFRPDLIAQGKEGVSEIVDAINRLPEKYRVTLLLIYVEGLSYEEVSEILDCSLTALRSRVHRAKKLLAEML